MTFGEKVRELRIRNGYSQDRLAEMTGVTKRTVRNWETEGKYPRSQALYTRLASALGCNEEYLRGEQELFLTRAAEQYGTRGQQQAQAFFGQYTRHVCRRRPLSRRYRYDRETLYGDVLGGQGKCEEVYAFEIQRCRERQFCPER